MLTISIRQKYTQQSTHGTYQKEHILEGKGLPLGVLGVGGRRGIVVEDVAPPRRDECSCSVGIICFCMLTMTKTKQKHSRLVVE